MSSPSSSSSSPSSTSSSSSSLSSSTMWWDISLQVAVFLFSIATYLYTNKIPQKLIEKYHSYRNRDKHQARRHFVIAAEHLSNDRLSSAVKEAESAIDLDPTDAANHILKSLALELQGFKTSALEALDVALSPLAVGSLEKEEKADAMVKRAALRMEVSKIGRGEEKGVDLEVFSAAEKELREAVEMKESGKGWCLLGECCEGLGKKEDAAAAYAEAVRVVPESVVAKEGLERLGLVKDEINDANAK